MNETTPPPNDEVVMTVALFIEGQQTDPNLFWRLSCGDHQNLLDEAVDAANDLGHKVQFLVNFMAKHGFLEEGKMTFPDGDTWTASDV